MNLSRLAVPVLLSSVLFGCASTPDAPRKEFKPLGEVRFTQSGTSLTSSFSEDRIVSTGADLSKTSDGSWRGRIGNAIVDVNVYPNRVSGSGLTVNREEAPGREVYTAQTDGKIFRFEIDASKILVRAPHFSATLGKNADGSFGPGGVMKLTGEAAAIPAKWPQLPLALVAAFSSAASASGHNMN